VVVDRKFPQTIMTRVDASDVSTGPSSTTKTASPMSAVLLRTVYERLRSQRNDRTESVRVLLRLVGAQMRATRVIRCVPAPDDELKFASAGAAGDV
jgi:hypothetical protein